jgi:hypothetical protein
LNIDVSIERHFYTTDYFQKAFFFKGMQLLSIYYLVNYSNPGLIPVAGSINNIPKVEGAQAFRWIAINKLSPDYFTFPIDKKVIELLKTTL